MIHNTDLFHGLHERVSQMMRFVSCIPFWNIFYFKYIHTMILYPHVYQYIAGSSIIHEYVWIKQLKNDKSIIHIGRWTHMRHPIYHPYRTDAMGVYCGYMRIPILVQTCLTRNGYNMVKFSQNRTHHGSSARDKMWCIFVSLKVDWFARYNIGVVYNM